MKINTPKNKENVIITLSPLEYRRLYQIIEDHAIEYGIRGDIIFDMFQVMESFKEEK